MQKSILAPTYGSWDYRILLPEQQGLYLSDAGHSRHFSVTTTVEGAVTNTNKVLRQQHLPHQPAAVLGPGPKAFVEVVQQGPWLLSGKAAANNGRSNA